MILARLPSYDLIHAQRVSKLWHQVIKSSPTLQRKLHFRAATTGPLTDPGCLPKGFGSDISNRLGEDEYGGMSIEVPTALQVVNPQPWSTMFAFQPPIDEMSAYFIDDENNLIRIDSLEREGGITLGDMIEFIKETLPEIDEEDRHEVTLVQFDMLRDVPADNELQGDGS